MQKFELVPYPEGKEAFPSHFTPDCWPAADDKQHRYRPVPTRSTKTINLWHMGRHSGPHTEVYWYHTVPKKVDGTGLYRPAGTVDDVVGYGVHMHERLNEVLVLWWSLVSLAATGGFVVVYSRCTGGDNSSALGLGAYLMAAFTVHIQLQYAWWKGTWRGEGGRDMNWMPLLKLCSMGQKILGSGFVWAWMGVTSDLASRKGRVTGGVDDSLPKATA